MGECDGANEGGGGEERLLMESECGDWHRFLLMHSMQWRRGVRACVILMVCCQKDPIRTYHI